MSVTFTCAKCHQSLATCICLPAYNTHTYVPLLPQSQPQTFTFVPQLTEEQVRKIVREEVGNALAELKHEMNMQGWKL